MIDRRSVLAGLAGSLALPALARAATPTRVAPGLLRSAAALGIRVNGGGPDTVIEFFDYNCAYCRQSLRDFQALVGADPRLNYILVNYGVLGQSSAEAARVALAFAGSQGPARYFAFHQALLGGFGGASGERALALAERQGADRASLAQASAGGAALSRHEAGVALGRTLALQATPSFIINGQLFHGQIGLALKQRALAPAALS